MVLNLLSRIKGLPVLWSSRFPMKPIQLTGKEGAVMLVLPLKNTLYNIKTDGLCIIQQQGEDWND